MRNGNLRDDARAIWDAAVAAVDPVECVRRAAGTLDFVRNARRIVVVGGGKAGAAMAAGLESVLAERLSAIEGVVNIPAGTERPLQAIRLNVARPAGTNEPTVAGVVGTLDMLRLVEGAGPDDAVIALISGGGSALMPLPADGISLEDKQAVTRLLHRSGATIAEMNCVRKHLSRFKGGGLAAAARCPLVALIVSDVIGDPLDAIASGPTAADPTTFADAIAILRTYRQWEFVPSSVSRHLEEGQAARRPETLKSLPATVRNIVCGNNSLALAAAEAEARKRGYAVHNLGPEVSGDTGTLASVIARGMCEIRFRPNSIVSPACLLVGGETTVHLPAQHGKGGRNTEFVLAALVALQGSGLRDFVVLSGGTDGEDGPTDAAGAIGDDESFSKAAAAGLDPVDALRRHDSYTFFDATGDLIRTGLTQTNVMDVRVLLVGETQ